MPASASRLLLGLLLATAAPALAQTPLPLGPQFQVNTGTADTQLVGGVAMTPDGDFVVVWDSIGTTYPAASSVEGQRYAADGSPAGSQFQVDTAATGIQAESAVALAPDGDFVITWSHVDSIVFPGPSLYDVMAQRYAAGGTPSGANFQVNAGTTAYQFHADVAIASDGDFVVVWEDKPLSGPTTLEGRLFDAAGAPVSAEIPIATSGEQLAVAAAPNGDFTVVWAGFAAIGSDTSPRSVQARRYAGDGSPLTAAFQVNTYTTGHQMFPDVAVAPDGNFVVVWTSYGSAGTDTSYTSVQGQRFAASGAPVGGEFQVNTVTTGAQNAPAVAIDADGDFVVVWQSNPVIPMPPDPGELDIFGQHFAADGTPQGSEFQVSTYPTDVVQAPRVAAGDDGFVVAWSSDGSPGNDGSSYSVQARRYAVGVQTQVPSLSAPLAIGCAVLLLTVAALARRRV